MEWPLVLLIIFASLVILMLTSFPIAFCFMVINLVGVYVYWGGEAGLSQLIRSTYTSVARFPLLTIPLFVLMGEVLFQSGLGFQLIDVIDKWMGRLPGRLGLLAVAAGTLFGATSGSSIASTAMLGGILTPDMERRGYKKPISIGAIMGSGALALIIPPSGFAVLVATIAEISIGQLLIAGLIPGLLLAFQHGCYIILRCWLQPSIAPPYKVIPTPLKEKIGPTVRMALPLMFIIFMVLGLIFLGVSTPTEAAAMGALACLIMSAVYKRLNWQMLKKSVTSALHITAMVLIIIASACAFGQILAFSGATRGLVELATGLTIPPLAIMAIMQFIIIIMGCFMDVNPIALITIPIYMPIVSALGFDPIWFGLILLINLDMAMLTPPFGILLFVMKGVAPRDTTIKDIILAAFPFLISETLVMVYCMLFPIIPLWLPNMMH